ncbi:MAG: type II restriction endonuclease [Firmicutes bacterium]|nr:type II restriction endonuclease [Bacillota bacterium]
MRDFKTWLSQFKTSISDFGYYIDFKKVYRNIGSFKVELNIMNSLINSKNIEKDFKELVEKYPEIIKCIPLLLAIRGHEVFIIHEKKDYIFNFKKCDNVDDCVLFMRESGLFDLISKHIINNLVDYATGVEVGLDSNGRKNRGGTLMENVVEAHIKTAELNYQKEMYLSDIEKNWGLDLSSLSNKGKSKKKFDFVIKTDNMVYAVETNFYAGGSKPKGGSKLNETARSYKLIAQESKKIDGFKFVWITDGTAWKTAKNNLEETFDVLDDIYNLNELESGILTKVIK